MEVVVVVAGLTFPAVLSLLDCSHRDPADFARGADDRRAWLRWLVIAVPLCLLGVGYAIVLGYYYTVVRRNSPMRR